MTLVIIGITVVLFAIGFEMLLVLGIPSLLLKLAYFPHMPNEVLLQKMVAGMNHSTLMAIPFFILAAETMVQGQIAPRLTNLVRVFIGHYRGGLGSTTVATAMRSEEHTSELQSLMRNSYAVYSLKKKNSSKDNKNHTQNNNY